MYKYYKDSRKISLYSECIRHVLVLVLVFIVESVGIVHRNRLCDWIKSRCYIERYSPLDLFEPACGVRRILRNRSFLS